MKRIVLSACSVVAMSSLVFAGGDMKDVEPAVEPVIAVPVLEKVGPFYVGGALTAVVGHDSSVGMELIDGTPGVDNDRLGNMTLLAGYDFNQYFAVEGRYSTSIFNEDVTEMSGWSLFVKPQYRFDESNFKLYALLGYGGVNIEGVNNYFADVDDSGFQWGIGAAYAFGEYMDNNNLAVFFDYTSLAYEMDGIFANGATQTDVDAFTLGVTYNF